MAVDIKTMWVLQCYKWDEAKYEEWREDDHEIIEYEDELGRTRTGTKREAREAESQRRKDEVPATEEQDQSSYAEVMYVSLPSPVYS